MTGHLVKQAPYEELIERLLDLQRREASLAPLEACFQALGAVLCFLNADARVKDSEATKPLFQLLFAIFDRQRGAKPELFFDASDLPDKSAKPTHTSSIILRAVVNTAFFILLEAGMSQQEAGKWLARELEHSGIKQSNGRPIETKVIARWRAEYGGKAPKGSDEALVIFVQGLRERYLQEPSDAAPTQQGAKMAAALFIKLLRTSGF